MPECTLDVNYSEWHVHETARGGKTLSPRIEKIASLVRPGHTLFDLCCDHGRIGFAALSRAKEVIFVDQSANALRAVHEHCETLEASEQARTQIRVSPGELLDLSGFGPSDFVIAGVGVTTIVSIISALFPETLGQNRLILSPQQDSLPLRWYLRDRGFGLVEEHVVLERGRYREMLVIEAKGAEVGEAFVSEEDEEARAYQRWLEAYRQTIAERKAKSGEED